MVLSLGVYFGERNSEMNRNVSSFARGLRRRFLAQHKERERQLYGDEGLMCAFLGVPIEHTVHCVSVCEYC